MAGGVISAVTGLLLFLGASVVVGQQPPRVAFDTVRGIPRVTNLARRPTDLPQFELHVLWQAGGMDAPSEAQFVGPFLATALGSSGEAWILDQNASRLTLFGAGGNYEKVVAGPGGGPGELGFPSAISVDSLGRVWVASPIDGRYTIFGPGGELIRTFRQPYHAINRRVFTFVPGRRFVLDHARGYPTVKFFRADTLGVPVDSFVLKVPDIGFSGIVRPGSALLRVAWLRPAIRWTMSRDGESIWTARSDSLGFSKLSVHGDTLLRVEARHRTAEFTAQQRTDMRTAEQQMHQPAVFAPLLVQALYGLDGGGFLVQVGPNMDEPGRELDWYGGDGVLKGVVHSPIPMSNRSELSSKGDTLLFVGLGAYDVPILVKATIARAAR